MTATTLKSTNLLTLAELLDKSQPYKDVNHLHDTELSELDENNNQFLPRMQGSLLGLAIGDALGASVEFRPKSYMEANPVTDMQGGGTWGLDAGQWTDDTSMALCLAASLIVKGGFNGYDQMVRYKRWYRNGYMSSTGTCFDIGASTRAAIEEFEKRQRRGAQTLQKQTGSTISEHSLDEILEEKISQIQLDVQCGAADAAGNGPLMRLAPIPLFYFLSKTDAIQNAGSSARFTHGDQRAIDACRFYSALIWNAINGVSKIELLDSEFFNQHFQKPLHKDVMTIVRGSYKTKNGYADGIRGKGFIINALEAALWAFYNDQDSFETGVLLAVNLGDDTDTTAAIYGQLAGAVYGIDELPQRWRDQLFGRDFLITLANGLFLQGKNFNRPKRKADAMKDVDEKNPPYKIQSRSCHNRTPKILPEYD